MLANSVRLLSCMLAFACACADPHFVTHDAGQDGPEDGQDGASALAYGDGGGDTVGDANGPRAFQDDFERPDGPIAGGPWSRGSSGIAETWEGRLCLADGGSAELALTPGQFRHLRVDVPGAVGLRMEVRNPHGTLFAVDFREDVVTSSGAKVMGHALFNVTRLQVDVDYDARNARVGEREGHFVSAPFAGNATNEEASSIRFSISAADSAAYHAVCLDNLYVAPELPSINPFLDSPQVNLWVPDSRVDSRCITAQCGDAMRESLNSSCGCVENSTCGCAVDVAPCATDCLLQHPSGTFSICTSVCARNVHQLSRAVVDCIDMMCGHDPRPLGLSLEPVTWPADGEPAPDTSYIGARGLTRGRVQLETWDLAASPRTRALGTFETADFEAVKLYAEPTHTRVIVNADFTESNGKLMVWQDGRFVEHMFPARIGQIEPSNSRHYIWVYTGGSAAQQACHLLTYDGRLLYRRELAAAEIQFGFSKPVYGPDEAYALFSYDLGNEQEVTILHFATGTMETERHAKSEWESWEVLWTFEQGVVWRKDDSRLPHANLAWSGFDGAPAPALPTPAPFRRDVPRGLLDAEEGLFGAGRHAPVRLATVLNEGSVLAADGERVLSARSDSFLIANAAGTLLGEFDADPETPQESSDHNVEVVPLTPDRGVFVVGDEGNWEIQAFEISRDALVITPLVTLNPYEDGTPAAYEISSRGGSNSLLIRSYLPYMYDTVTHELRSLLEVESMPALAMYPGQRDYYYTPE